MNGIPEDIVKQVQMVMQQQVKKDNTSILPVWDLRIGSIQATRWRNESFDNLVVERKYKDKNGEWKSSNNFSQKDVPTVIYVLQRALEEWR